MSGPPRDPLLQGLADGRPEAFALLYDRFGAGLFRVAYGLLGSRPDAEDAVQELFVGLVRAGPKLAGVDNLRAYLFAGLRHAARRLAERRKGQPADSPDLDAVARPEPRAPDQSACLEQALLRLPPEQRELVVLKIDGGLTFAEIASVLGISPNTAASRYRYALGKLRAALEE